MNRTSAQPIPVTLSIRDSQWDAKLVFPQKPNQKINHLQTWQGDCSIGGVTYLMSAQGTLVAPLKNSSKFFPTPTL
jgi:hypothetical protein